MNAAAVITEAGGATAHLAQIGRDRFLPIVLVVGARTKYPAGTTVEVSTLTRRVTAIEINDLKDPCPTS